MKKRMFNDKFKLTDLVIQRRKTMTSDILPELGAETKLVGTNENGDFEFRIGSNYNTVAIKPKFKLEEVVAVAQNYDTLYQEGIWNYDAEANLIDNYSNTAGWHNKMFVRPDLMPHLIVIEGIICGRIQEITDEDCIKEGIVQWRDFEDCPKNASEIAKNGFGYYGYWNVYATPKKAFAEFINKIFGKGTWERNPYRIAYEFTLIK